MNGGVVLSDHDQWLSKRQKIFKLSQGKYKFNKGDTRPKSSRYCSLCGRPLVIYKYGKYITIKDYYLMKIYFQFIYVVIRIIVFIIIKKEYEAISWHYQRNLKI